MTRWTEADMPTLQGKTFVVTGSNSGLGYEAALAFARKGAHVVLACRNTDKAQEAARRIEGSGASGTVEARALDLASLASIRAFADGITKRYDRLDVLVNNAGVMALPRCTTADGFEMQLGTNHLGHFALTGLLLPSLEASGAGRVVNVSSLMHRNGRIALDDLQSERRYEKWAAYGQSKLANLLFTRQLQAWLAQRQRPVLSVAAHPGYAATQLQFVGPQMEGSRFMTGLMRFMNSTLAQSAAAGAWPTEYAATMGDVVGGACYGPSGTMQVWGPPTRVPTSAAAQDDAVAAALWERSEELTGVRYR